MTLGSVLSCPLVSPEQKVQKVLSPYLNERLLRDVHRAELRGHESLPYSPDRSSLSSDL